MLVLTVFLSGAALLPFVGMPEETFEWQRYARVYEEPNLVANHSSGQPGSYFHFFGSGFNPGSGLSPDSTVTVSANNVILGATNIDGLGDVEFILSTVNGCVGSYYVTVDDGSLSLTERIVLSNDAPLHPMEGVGDQFSVPSGICLTEIFFPVIGK
jgi:hypothetical protein